MRKTALNKSPKKRAIKAHTEPQTRLIHRYTEQSDANGLRQATVWVENSITISVQEWSKQA